MSMIGTRTDLYNLGIPVEQIKSAIAGAGGTVTAASITDATTVGRSLLTATNAAAARTAIGATTVGGSLITAADAAAARTAISAVDSAGAVAAMKAKTQIAALTAVSTPDGSDAATTQTLANALKVAVNAIVAALKA